MTAKSETNYTRTHRLKGDVLRFFLDDVVEELDDRADRSSRGRSSKTLVKEGRLRVTVVSLSENETMETRTTEGPVTLQCLRGHIRVRTHNREMDMSPGELMALNTMVDHSVTAMDNATFLLTLALEEEAKTEVEGMPGEDG